MNIFHNFEKKTVLGKANENKSRSHYTGCSIITVAKDFALHLINKQKMLIKLIQMYKIIIWL